MFSKASSESLQKKSADILSVFTKTVNDLQKVNDQAATQSTSNREEARKLVAEADNLDIVVQNNSKVIGKINAILEN